ncbi:MAG TPA: L,D-transpeptidase [Ignavibacteriales bacterium]|nr:L,D-transpeptidase [Ignavibacteriales bacterium]
MVLNLRDVPLSEALAEKHMRYMTNVHLLVDRRNYRLELYSDTVLVKSYRAVFGRNNGSHGRSAAENQIAPAGNYQICEIDTSSEYHKFLRLNFPNYKDITEAFKSGIISEGEYETLYGELEAGGCPKSDKKKFPAIGIHGTGRLNFIFKNLPFTFNWTNGSVAVSNENIDEIYSVIKPGTEVDIKN